MKKSMKFFSEKNLKFGSLPSFLVVDCSNDQMGLMLKLVFGPTYIQKLIFERVCCSYWHLRHVNDLILDNQFCWWCDLIHQEVFHVFFLSKICVTTKELFFLFLFYFQNLLTILEKLQNSFQF